MFGALVVLLFISGLIHLKAATADKVKTTQSNASSSMDRTIPPRTETAQESPPTVLPDKRIVAKITPEELLGLFNGVTTSQGNQLMQPYIGKWLQVSGEIEDISDFTEKETRISFDRAGTGVLVLMYFDKEWLEHVSILSRGERITVRGQIARVEKTGYVALDHCEIVG